MKLEAVHGKRKAVWVAFEDLKAVPAEHLKQKASWTKRMKLKAARAERVPLQAHELRA